MVWHTCCVAQLEGDHFSAGNNWEVRFDWPSIDKALQPPRKYTGREVYVRRRVPERREGINKLPAWLQIEGFYLPGNKPSIENHRDAPIIWPVCVE